MTTGALMIETFGSAQGCAGLRARVQNVVESAQVHEHGSEMSKVPDLFLRRRWTGLSRAEYSSSARRVERRGRLTKVDSTTGAHDDQPAKRTASMQCGVAARASQAAAR